MKKFIYLTLIILTGLFRSEAQTLDRRSCGTMDHQAELLKADPSLRARMNDLERQAAQWIQQNPQQKNAAVITIPVVVHVVWNTTSQNISDAQVLSQIDVLNEDFARLNADKTNTPAAFSGLGANTNIQFCMAKRDPNGNATNGIIRKQTSTTSFSSNDNIKKTVNGGDNAWPAGQYLNMWSGNLSGGLLGYAQFPGGPAATDGVVILYNAFGRVGNVAAPFHKGRTATHEVGHWLNLYHIWGDDGSACSGSDQVTDTPNQSDENYGCPAYPLTDGCSSASPGVMFMNYMDYTDDACMNIFTNGQSTRMNSSINTTRSSLLTSQGCVPPAGGGGCGVPSGLAATGITTTSATLGWAVVSGANSYNIQHRAIGAASWISSSSTTNSKAISGLTASTQYEFQVKAVCATTSSNFSSSANFSTPSAGCTDNYEPNNTLANAKPVPVNVDVTGLISTSTDGDWFSFTTTSPNTKIKVTLTNLPGDYDMKLVNSTNSTTFGTSQNGGTTNETIILNTSTARQYRLKVYGYSGTFNANICYTLRVSTSSSNFRSGNGEVIADENEQILTVYPNPVKDFMTVQFNSSKESYGDIHVFDMLGRTVMNLKQPLEKGINKFEMNMSELNKGIYFVEVNNGSEKEIRKLVIDK